MANEIAGNTVDQSQGRNEGMSAENSVSHVAMLTLPYMDLLNFQQMNEKKLRNTCKLYGSLLVLFQVHVARVVGFADHDQIIGFLCSNTRTINAGE